MAERRPDVVEVVVLAADAHALLRRRGARVVALLAAEEQVLELVHPGVGEEQRRIVAGHERRARRRCGGRAARSTRGRTRGSRSRSSRLFYRVTRPSEARRRSRGPARTPGRPGTGTARRNSRSSGDRLAPAQPLARAPPRAARRRRSPRRPRRSPAWRVSLRDAGALELQADADPAAACGCRSPCARSPPPRADRRSRAPRAAARPPRRCRPARIPCAASRWRTCCFGQLAPPEHLQAVDVGGGHGVTVRLSRTRGSRSEPRDFRVRHARPAPSGRGSCRTSSRCPGPSA